MSRFGVFWFILVIVTGMTNFLVKQHVQGLDDQLNHIRKQTIDEQKKIHDLTADWTFLNQPELLADLNSRYLHLTAASPKQLATSFDDIPLRPAPPPPPPPEIAPVIAQAMPSAPAPVAPPAPSLMPPPMIVPVAATAPVRAAPQPAVALATTPVRAQPAPFVAPTPAPAQPPAPTRTASLDGLFAQVAGGR